MEIVILEKQVYEDLLHKIEFIASRLELLHSRNNDKSLKPWLDSQEVCDIIRVSKRQLQTYRENGKLGFSQIGHKIYYRPLDIQKFIDQHTNNTLCQK